MKVSCLRTFTVVRLVTCQEVASLPTPRFDGITPRRKNAVELLHTTQPADFRPISVIAISGNERYYLRQRCYDDGCTKSMTTKSSAAAALAITNAPF
ncbi:hypothetical protein J6590_057363 [Homalodisca vitripennis]|nr:hypothetical protein J6590_057363 [Homalodisca vitripennis]